MTRMVHCHHVTPQGMSSRYIRRRKGRSCCCNQHQNGQEFGYENTHAKNVELTARGRSSRLCCFDLSNRIERGLEGQQDRLMAVLELAGGFQDFKV